MPSPEAIRTKILALVKQYHHVKFAPTTFDPDKDMLHYTGGRSNTCGTRKQFKVSADE